MAAPVTRGGFVVTTRTNNVVGQVTVDNNVLLEVVKALGIPQRAPNVKIDEGIDQIKSIYIYRGD
jgi:hypothetical protein